MANDLNINWKDGVGEVTDQPLTVSPGSGAGSALVSFGSVMAYITSDGKRWLTSDNRVYGVLKSDASYECTGDCP